jgi:hypothetical protein
MRQWGPMMKAVGLLREWPPRSLPVAESNRGRASQSIEPLRPTIGALSQLPMRA